MSEIGNGSLDQFGWSKEVMSPPDALVGEPVLLAAGGSHV
jgi:hypothetical protein